MSVEDNKATLKRYYDEVMNKGNLSNWDAMVDESYVMHLIGAPQPLVGLEGGKQTKAQKESFSPDGQISIDELVAEGDIIAIHGTAAGTHTGEYQGIQPTGKKFTREYAAFYRFKNGKIVEGWALHNLLGFYQQLGITPPTG